MEKKHWFENPIRTAGIRAAVFLFVLALAGCDGEAADGTEPYTFRFKVQNNSVETITKVEFLNGTNRDAFVLRRTSGLNLGPNELSDEYRVAGFTGEYGTGERYCAVIVTYGDGTDIFGYGHYGPESKILVTSRDDWRGNKEIGFSPGNW